MKDLMLFSVAVSHGCHPVWADGIFGPRWHCGCADGLHCGDQQCSVLSFESARRTRPVKEEKKPSKL